MSKANQETIKALIEQGITEAQEISKQTGLSINRVYEIRKELGYSKRQLKALKEQKKTQEQNTNGTTTPLPESPETTSNTQNKPNLEDVRYFIPTHNGEHKYIERRIGKKTDMQILEALYKERMPTLIIGETGTGKTFLVHHFCYVHKLPLYRVNLNGSTTPEHLIGRWTPTAEGGFRWTDGILTTFVRHGGVIVIDEINSANAEILFCIHSLLDDDRQICLIQKDGEVIKAHKDFWAIATCNPDYEGTKPLNLALKDRFEILKFDYDEKVESKLVKDENMIGFARKIRKLYKEQEIRSPLSTRALMRNDKLKETFGKEIADIFLLNKFHDEEVNAIAEVLHIGKKDKPKEGDEKKEGEVKTQ
jgi:MoxR-like ATPase